MILWYFKFNDEILNKAAVNQFHSWIIPSRVFCFASKLSSLNATPREKQEGKDINNICRFAYFLQFALF
jgi:hypothetical protein